MVKAKDIRNIPKEIEKYKKLLEKETDPIKQLKYKMLLREQEYRLMDVEYQLINIEIAIYRDTELHKNMFVDKYIKGLTVEQMKEKYMMSDQTVYRRLNRAKLAFESNVFHI
ncbi:MAG: hypothetical protein ACLVL6_14020 [Clostridium paraputrificum]